MAARLGGQVSVAQWTDFTRRAAVAVKAASPRSRIGAGGLYQERAFLAAFLDIAEVELITFDIYDLAGLPTFTELFGAARQRGKGVHVEETWRLPLGTLGPGVTLEELGSRDIGLQVFQPLDVKWLQAVALYLRCARDRDRHPLLDAAVFPVRDVGWRRTRRRVQPAGDAGGERGTADRNLLCIPAHYSLVCPSGEPGAS